MPTRAIAAIKEFLRLEAAGGIMVVGAAALGMILANSPLNALYKSFLSIPVTVKVGELSVDHSLLIWINDGLMAIFFFLVALEIKREVLEGELSSISKATLPTVAAIGGMAVPALVYVFFNWSDPEALRGWAIPAATDIAFALGVLALLGTRAPASLKLFLLALAIIDDIGAIVVIAVFFKSKLSVLSLALAAFGFVLLLSLNYFRVTRVSIYVVIGIAIWVCVLKSGVHATLTGVVVGLCIPLRATDEEGHSPLLHLEHQLHPWVAFFILPLFAFANAGVSLLGLDMATMLAPVPLGIAAGLFIGKQIGVFGFTFVAVKLGIGERPQGASWMQIYGVSLLTGIGFTMSLFIGTLAFTDPAAASTVRLGVLTGSLLSAVCGYLVLWLASARQPAPAPAQT